MFKDVQKVIAAEYSGARAKENVAGIIQYHRIQASPGFRAAAQHCQRLLAGWGVQAEVLSFPANEDTAYWGLPMFQEWEASAATCDLIEPADKARKLADFQEIPVSLIQRSEPVENWEGEVVLLEDGEEAAEYEGLDVRGKIVLTRGNHERVRELAVGQFGAVGILFDGMRESPPIRQRIDLPDARQYTSFWWRPGDKRCFGFVLSPRQGEELRRWCRAQQREGKPPLHVRANVASRSYDGQMEVVSALIPGETSEEVVVVAHLCHPRPSANDNASGAGAVLELARALQHLMESGKLLRPKRGIRMLWVPEMTGTYAYLATHEDEIPHMVAGLNLDMVGENQDLCGSVFIVERPPAALPSFAADLLERLREEWMGETPNLAGLMSYPLFRHTVSPFSGGSDHYILSDPTVGVPTPMLIQWPDKFYHTSEDTLEKVDPRMLAVVGGLATTYAYWVANAGPREARWLGQEMNARFRARLTRQVQDDLTAALTTQNGEEVGKAAERIGKRVQFAAERQRQALRTLQRLAPREPSLTEVSYDVGVAAQQEIERAQAVLTERAHELGLREIPGPEPKPSDESDQQASLWVPERRFRGPVSTNSYLFKLDPKEREETRAWFKQHQGQSYALTTTADYWVDGRRTVAEIASLVEMETGQRNAELLLRHFRLLDRMGLMALRAK